MFWYTRCSAQNAPSHIYIYMYIGETGRTLATGMKYHLKLRNQLTAVREHCVHEHHNTSNDIRVLTREDIEPRPGVRTPPHTQTISADEIDRIHRVGKPDQTQRRSILIKFATYRSKKRVVVNRRYLNPLKRAERDRAQTPGNHCSDDNRRATTAPTDRRLYINDDLTKYRQQLLYRCRQEKKANKIADCWSTDGTILVKTINHKIAVVRNATELEHMCV